MVTKLQIFNMAIGLVGGTRMVADTDTNTAEGLVLNDSFATIMDEVLASMDWGFARRVITKTKTKTETVAAAGVNATNETFDVVSNIDDWITGMAVRLTTTGGLPGGLALLTTYYIIRVSITTIKLASSLDTAIANAAINLTSQGTGNHTITHVDPNLITRDIYTVPSDSVAVWQVGEDQYCNNEDDWSLENDLIIMPYGGPDTLYVRYTQRITNPAKFSSTFVPVLAARFAVELCIPVTQNDKLYALLFKVHADRLKEAKNIDGLQGKNTPFRQSGLISVRNT